MKYRREHRIYEAKSGPHDRDHMIKMAKERRFKDSNTIEFTIHSIPGTAQEPEEFIKEFADFVAPYKIEFILKVEHLEDGNFKLSFGDDLRSHLHIHGVAKGRMCEFKEIIELWNKHAPAYGVKLMAAAPIRTTVANTITYMFKENDRDDGMVRASYSTLFKQKRCYSTDWLWISSMVFNSMLRDFKHLLQKHLLILAKHVVSSIECIAAVYLIIRCISGLPNGPPVTFLNFIVITV